MLISLNYGESGQFTCDLPSERVLAVHMPPAPLDDVAEAVRTALHNPLDFPPLSRAVVPGDHVVLAADRHTPQLPLLLREVWAVLERQGVDPGDITILQPAALGDAALSDPRSALPAEVRDAIRWQQHDPTDETQLGYLATTAGTGERIYLARTALEADLVIPIGQVAYDPLLGYRGTSSVLYPGLSNTEAIAKSHGQVQADLGPDEIRLMREQVDEVGWLLGTQFAIQVVAGSGAGAAVVLAGLDQSVLAHGKQFLSRHWRLKCPARPETVVVAVDRDAAGHGWKQVAAAIAAARNLVKRNGQIIVLSELDAELDNGLKMLRDSRSAKDALKPLHRAAPPDLVPAMEIALGVAWARVYLLSKLAGELVEDLFMVPLESSREAIRLLEGITICAVLGSAQHTFAQASPRSPRGVADKQE